MDGSSHMSVAALSWAGPGVSKYLARAGHVCPEPCFLRCLLPLVPKHLCLMVAPQVYALLLLSRFSRVRLCATPSSVPGILQARILEWVAISFSRYMLRSLQLSLLIKKWADFPGGSVARTLHPQCRGHRFDPWSGS